MGVVERKRSGDSAMKGTSLRAFGWQLASALRFWKLFDWAWSHRHGGHVEPGISYLSS